ncbi:forkhead box protein N2-like isoform X1 [Diaphorina citri]|uniref:Forkhead box protein N2-like isoform X1 n=1 Tax=Diaphorina citri TaxID=121845 RepID=A0A1S4E7S1_DIACI|nr:forkhead box protein N2-like isoform X2 [Diaphorina citri]XP_026677132.1 forkhead box protein N2-like isoform X1 [Diaphorina citri]XP_026677133.1 forkhead box protein N2-like isoform X1 [Diaphorina citri]XP_026677134.1 forkhead box protein N2-like isoform X1 [Diaphorina citri]
MTSLNSSDLTSLIWLQNDDILKHINSSATPGGGGKHFINVITSAAPMSKPILMFKPHMAGMGQVTAIQAPVTQAELTQLVASSGTVMASGLQSHQVEEIKYIEMKDYSEDSYQSNISTGSSTLHSINVQVSPNHHSSSGAGPPYSPPSKVSPHSSAASSPGGAGSSTSGGAGSTASGSLPPMAGAYKKPPFSYSQLVFMSIENSTEKALPLREIYSWIEKYFPYYKNAPTGWKNSIRHELSYKNYFKKVTTTTKFIKGAWSVDKVYRPKLYTKLKSFLNCDEKLNYNLNKCLCETVSKYDLFSFINNNNDDDINAASIIMELKNQNGTPCKDTSRLEGATPLKAAKQKRKQASEKVYKNNNNHMVSNLNTQVATIVADTSDDTGMTHMKFYEISPHKRIKVEHHGELEGEEPVVNIKIEDPSPEEYGFDPNQMEVKSEIIIKEETCDYDGTLVASEVLYQEDVTAEREEIEDEGTRAQPYGDIIQDAYGEIRDAYVEDGQEEEEEEKRKRDGAVCALLHLAGISSSMDSATRSNAGAKSRNASKSAPGRRKLKVLKSANSNTTAVQASIKKNNSWTLLTYPELFACANSNSSSSTVKTGDIER